MGLRFTPATDFAETKPLSLDAIYLGGATLIGLATFGSVIGTRLIKGSNDAQEKRGVVLMFAGPAGLITAQGILMFFACCLGVNTSVFLCFAYDYTGVCYYNHIGPWLYRGGAVQELFFQTSETGVGGSS